MNAPCKGCEARELGCHSKCVLYQAYRLELDERKPKDHGNADYDNYVCRIRAKHAAHRVPNIRRKWEKDKQRKEEIK